MRLPSLSKMTGIAVMISSLRSVWAISWIYNRCYKTQFALVYCQYGLRQARGYGAAGVGIGRTKLTICTSPTLTGA
jgi:hypothetical protein